MAETVFKIPLANIPQRFEIELGGTTYIVENRYNPVKHGGWFLNFFDANGVPLLMYQ